MRKSGDHGLTMEIHTPDKSYTTIHINAVRGGVPDIPFGTALITAGLVDWVDLHAVHCHVRQELPSASLSEVQSETLETIRALVADELFMLGDLAGEHRRFAAWDESLDASIQKISDIYVTYHDDKPAWVWSAWMELTDKGERAARALEGGARDSFARNKIREELVLDATAAGELPISQVDY